VRGNRYPSQKNAAVEIVSPFVVLASVLMIVIMVTRPIIRAQVITAVIMLSLALYAESPLASDSLTLLATLVGERENDHFIECASAGDVNGDGFKDIIVGATQMLIDRGYAYVYFGGVKFDTIPDVRLIGEPFSPAGFSNFGILTACAGDVNNDGYDDVLVSANFGFNYDIWWRTGKVFLYFGGAEMDSIEDAVFQGSFDDYIWYGSSISSAGDVNQDGYDDVIIGCPEYPGGWGMGRAYIYFGSDYMDEQFDVCIQGDTGDGLGCSLRGIGDVNKDGYDDVLVGVPYDGQTRFEGRTSIYFGGDPMDTIPDLTFWGDSVGFQFAGHYISGAGDVNGDSYPDLVISASSKVKLFLGGTGMDTIADIILTGEEPVNEPFSYKVSDAGDLNRDGFGDLMIDDPSVGDSPLGKVYLFYGGPDMDSLFDIVLTGDPEPWSNFGTQMAALGDVNADGFDEIVVSSHGDSTNRGKIFIFTSSPSAVSDDDREHTSRGFRLSQNYPNPFNSGTSIQYTVSGPERGNQTHATLQIYNIRGQLVRTLVDEERQPGTYRIAWDGKNDAGQQVASGIYLYRLSVGAVTQEKKMLLLK
jgi:hypothetical protein